MDTRSYISSGLAVEPLNRSQAPSPYGQKSTRSGGKSSRTTTTTTTGFQSSKKDSPFSFKGMISSMSKSNDQDSSRNEGNGYFSNKGVWTPSKKEKRSRRKPKSRINNLAKVIVLNLNIFLFIVGIFMLGLALYFLFADWGDLDRAFFISTGITIILAAVFVAVTSHMGCLGLDNQTRKFRHHQSSWTGRKILCCYQVAILSILISTVALAVFSLMGVAVIDDNLFILEEVPYTNYVVDTVPDQYSSELISDIPAFEGFEESFAKTFNEFFFGAASVCYDSGNAVYPWFWEFINTYCPSEMDQLSCQKCYDYSVTNCLADQQTCYQNSWGYPEQANFACPYTICREELLNFLSTRIRYFLYAMFSLIFIIGVHNFSNMMLTCYTPKDSVDVILVKAGLVKSRAYQDKMQQNSVISHSLRTGDAQKFKSRKNVLEEGRFTSVRTLSEVELEEEALSKSKDEYDIDHMAGSFDNEETKTNSTAPQRKPPRTSMLPISELTYVQADIEITQWIQRRDTGYYFDKRRLRDLIDYSNQHADPESNFKDVEGTESDSPMVSSSRSGSLSFKDSEESSVRLPDFTSTMVRPESDDSSAHLPDFSNTLLAGNSAGDSEDNTIATEYSINMNELYHQDSRDSGEINDKPQRDTLKTKISQFSMQPEVEKAGKFNDSDKYSNSDKSRGSGGRG